jgi:predicted transcriptional regulator of viral defense system
MHGVAYSIFNRFTYLTSHKAKAFEVSPHRFQPTSWPKALQSESRRLGIIQMNRQGIDIWVTNLERTFVDVLDRVELAGGWEEVVRSIHHIAVLDLSQLIDYCIKLGNARLVGKVGFFLQQKAKPFQPSEQQLKKLKQAIPQSPQYISKREEGPFEYIPEWNILLPRYVVHQYWEENSA